MNLVEVVILVGAQCLSPMQSGPGLTEVSKVSCAVLISEDPQTGDIAIIPPSAATDPHVIAMLVKPRNDVTTIAKMDRLPQAPAAEDGEITGSVTPAPRIVPTSAESDPPDNPPKARPVVKKKRAAVAKASTRSVSRRDACGSYRAVWYTNKDGRRKYRCVKTG